MAHPTKGHLSYQARFLKHRGSRIHERLPPLKMPLFLLQRGWPYKRRAKCNTKQTTVPQ